MKANELMIGDWVEYRFTGWTEKGGVYKDYQYVQISTIGDLYIKADNDRVASACGELFYPIPLTPEILEKNGFGFTRNNNTDSVWNGWWIYEGLELAVANLNKEGNWPCFINIYDSNILCEYVHQLQHALRLCGIEKEIVLR